MNIPERRMSQMGPQPVSTMSAESPLTALSAVRAHWTERVD